MICYRRETALQRALALAKSGRLELGDNILRTLYVYLQPLRHNRPAKLSSDKFLHDKNQTFILLSSVSLY